jgi:hypothetical protein
MDKPHLKPAAAMLFGGLSKAMQSTAHAAASYDDPAMQSWTPWPGSADADLLGEHGTLDPAPALLGPRPQQRIRRWCRPDPAQQHRRRPATPGGRPTRPAPARLGARRGQGLGHQHRGPVHHLVQRPLGGRRRPLGGLGLTLQALGGWFLNGEAFAIPHWLPRQGARWNTRIQVIEADRVETPPDLRYLRDIRGGIQVDQYGVRSSATSARAIRGTIGP